MTCLMSHGALRNAGVDKQAPSLGSQQLQGMQSVALQAGMGWCAHEAGALPGHDQLQSRQEQDVALPAHGWAQVSSAA